MTQALHLFTMTHQLKLRISCKWTSNTKPDEVHNQWERLCTVIKQEARTAIVSDTIEEWLKKLPT